MQLRLADRMDILDGSVIRQRKAYPVYDDGYEKNVSKIREVLEGGE